MKILCATTALGDALSKCGSKTSCINLYTPVFRHSTPRLTRARNVAQRIL